jgi:hypothetical protein
MIRASERDGSSEQSARAAGGEVRRGEGEERRSRRIARYDRGLDRPTTPRTTTQDCEQTKDGTDVVGVCGDGEVTESLGARALPLHLIYRLLVKYTFVASEAVVVFAVTNGQQEMNEAALCTPRGDPGRALPLGNRTSAARLRTGSVAELQTGLNLHPLLRTRVRSSVTLTTPSTMHSCRECGD